MSYESHIPFNTNQLILLDMANNARRMNEPAIAMVLEKLACRDIFQPENIAQATSKFKYDQRRRTPPIFPSKQILNFNQASFVADKTLESNIRKKPEKQIKQTSRREKLALERMRDQSNAQLILNKVCTVSMPKALVDQWLSLNTLLEMVENIVYESFIDEKIYYLIKTKDNLYYRLENENLYKSTSAAEKNKRFDLIVDFKKNPRIIEVSDV